MPRIGPVLAALTALAAVSAGFYARQNAGAQIGGAISVPKILWLNYAIASWFILPAFLRTYPLSSSLRSLFTVHLTNFSVRAIAELFLLYVTVSWSPVYGIVHDVFSIALITAMAKTPAVNALERTAIHITWSIRITLCCEIAFAGMFHALTRTEYAIYFASEDPRFSMINLFTSVVVAFAYADMLWTLFRLRGDFWKAIRAHA